MADTQRREKYESPTVEKLDLGEQLRQARTLMTRVKTRIEELRINRDHLEHRVMAVEGVMEALSVDVELMDRLGQRIDLILELRQSQAVGKDWVGNDDRRKP